MEKRDYKKQAVALTMAIFLIFLIFSVLTPPTTAVYLHPGTPSSSSVTNGNTITFSNVNFTIRGPEAIPVEYLQYTIHKSNGDVHAYVRFNINGSTSGLSSSGTFTIPSVTGDEGIPYSGSGSYYGYDENTPGNHTFGYGYGYHTPGYSDITILYTIVYTTSGVGTGYYGKLSVNSSTYTYTSAASSTFNIVSSGGGPSTDDDDTTDDDTTDDDDTTTDDAITTSEENLDTINANYSVELDVPFNATDSDGDGTVDTLNDPNGVLKQVQNKSVLINGSACLLISTKDDYIPEFFWDTEADTFTPITPATGTVSKTERDTENDSIVITINVDKSQEWICIDITDDYPENTITIHVDDNGTIKTISSDMFWRENGRIYILDDPVTKYIVNYAFNIFDPDVDPDPILIDTFNHSKPIIIYTYYEPVTLVAEDIEFTFAGAVLDNTYYSITSSSDNTTYTLEFNLTGMGEGVLEIVFAVKDDDGNTNTNIATYTIDLPGEQVVPEAPDEKDEIPWLLIAIILIFVIILFIIYLFKSGYLYVEYDEEKDSKEFEKIKPKKTDKTSEFEKIEKKETKSTDKKSTSKTTTKNKKK